MTSRAIDREVRNLSRHGVDVGQHFVVLLDVLDLVEDGYDGLLAHIKEQL